MGGFLKDTMELHKFYLDRLQGARDEGGEAVPALAGVMDTPRVEFAAALRAAEKAVPGLAAAASTARAWARRAVAEGRSLGLDEDEVAAVHVYTMASQFYRRLNAALRDRERDLARPFYPFLRLFLDAFARLPAMASPLWRGVHADLHAQYPSGGEVSIQQLSAFAGEAEYVIAPGTRFKVRSATVAKDKLCTVVLDELDAPRLVS